MDDFKGAKTSKEEVTTDAVEPAREPELEVEPEDVTEFLQARDRTSRNEEVLLMDEQRKEFFEIEFTPGDDAAKIAEITTKDLDVTQA